MKTEVYSWRISPDLKAELEEAARAERVSVAQLLERLTRMWLMERKAARADDAAEQERIRAAAMRFAGTIRGGDPERAKEAEQRVRDLLARKHGR